MYQTCKDEAQFFLVYIREAHPSDGNQKGGRQGKPNDPQVKQPTTEEERRAVAGECVKDMKLTMTALVDGMDNKVNQSYAGGPDRLYIVGKDGKIAYQGQKGPQGFNPGECQSVLKELLGK